MLVYFEDAIPKTRWDKAGFSTVIEATCLHSGGGHCCQAQRDDVSGNVSRDWPNASARFRWTSGPSVDGEWAYGASPGGGKANRSRQEFVTLARCSRPSNRNDPDAERSVFPGRRASAAQTAEGLPEQAAAQVGGYR